MSESIKKYVLVTATLAGTIIGVGIFSLPYITLKAGLFLTLGYFFVLTCLVLLIHLFFGEVALKTPDFLRLPGYAKIYLGKWGKAIALIASILGSFGALLAYIIIGAGFLTNLLSPIFGGSNIFYAFLYFAIGSIFIFFGIKIICRIEFWGIILFLFSLFLVFFKGFHQIKLSNIFLSVNYLPSGFENLFLPYGVILFALWGATMIPEIEEMLQDQKKSIKKVIFIGTIIPAICYLFFIFLVVGICGFSTSSEAVSGLENVLGGVSPVIMFFAGVVATFTSYIAIGLNLKNVFWYDIKIPKNLSWALTCFIPLALYLLGFKDFIKIIGFVGAIMLAIEGILILLMYKKIRPERKYLSYSLVLVFLVGIIYEIVYFVKF